MSGIIHLLPDHIANQIAAGEVVQRPASVVKELLENAVDAKATNITLNIKEAGKTLIQVIDDGLGMNAYDARLSFTRHATSKIKQTEDLFAISTKGFRGEALASIAAVAHVELKTRQDQQEYGTHLQIEGSTFTKEDVCITPKGTSFSVKNLFYNIPARRNFLKSDTVEYRHIVDEFQRLVIAHPSVAFIMYHNGSEVYNLPISNQRQRIVNLFGSKTNEKLVPIEESTDAIQIGGFIGKPEFAKKSKGEQFFVVNNRFIKSGYLHHAVTSAFEGLLKEGIKPSYFIYIQVPPHTIDVNIHPTKTEIKFDDEHTLYAILRASVKHSLGQFNVAPVLDFERDATLDTPYNLSTKSATLPTIELDDAFNPFNTHSTYKPKDTSYQKSSQNWEGLYVGLKNEFKSATYDYEVDSKKTFLFETKDTEQPLYRTYQIHKKYIVSPTTSGMIVVDQQRAHQRILYEQFLTHITVKKGASQQMLFPLELYYSKNEIEIIHELKDSLVNIGFVFDAISVDRVLISGLPIAVTESEASIVIDQLISDTEEGLESDSFSLSDKISKSMSKSLAIKTGTYLTETEQETLINNLFGCKEAGVSPFSKPTYLKISVEELDKKFAL